MTDLAIFTTDDAPLASAKILAALKAGLGFVPNIHGVFAASPTALKALTGLNEAFDQSSFSAAEREVISLTTSVFNECGYCVAGHSTFARMAGVSPATIGALRANETSEDQRLNALSRFTRALLRKRGAIDETEMQEFMVAGFRREQMLDLLVGIAAKTMTNFASKATNTPLDMAFVDDAWAPSNTPESSV
ncbi:MAG: carboxymuconolactone decarboxylase family protein [Novosphingobium sp.]|nr:carboxymuconolactone decarboxylase family protein [Novosphingobium sp.]